jgi:hypothetical protein
MCRARKQRKPRQPSPVYSLRETLSYALAVLAVSLAVALVNVLGFDPVAG